MIKLLSTTLLFFVCNAYANELSTKNYFKEEILQSNEKKIEYNLKVNKNDKQIYSSKFTITNSSLVPIFYREENNNGEKVEETVKGTNQENMNSISKAEKKEEVNSVQLKLALHLSKESNNMWSDFFFEEKVDNKIQEASMAKYQDKNGVSLIKTPKSSNLNKEFIVAHQNGEESLFSWDDYTFIFTANVK